MPEGRREDTNKTRAPSPQKPDPAGQSPEQPIEFASDDDVGRGNAERANAEPEPPALHDAQVPGTPPHDAGSRRSDGDPAKRG